MTEEEGLARRIIASEQVLRKMVDGVVFTALELGRESFRPLVRRAVPQHVVREGHRDIRSQLLAGDRVDLKDTRAHRTDALGGLEHRLILGKLVGRAEHLRADDLREGVGHRRHRRQAGHLQRQVGALLALGQQREREQQKSSQKEARG